jgi:methylmalonyl-CoA/ethylmalonyl-CoA epimerase
VTPANPPPGLPPALAGLPLDHVGIAVPDLSAGDAYAALGWTPEGPDGDVPSQRVRVRMLRGGPGPALELLAPLAGSGDDAPIARFLARRGPGLHHLAFAVADLEAAMARLAAEGAPFVDAAPRAGFGGHRVAFLHPRWSGGVLVELVERA